MPECWTATGLYGRLSVKYARLHNMRVHPLTFALGYNVVTLCGTRILYNLVCGLSNYPSAVRRSRVGPIFGMLAS
jgi:hypothetical protein